MKLRDSGACPEGDASLKELEFQVEEGQEYAEASAMACKNISNTKYWKTNNHASTAKVRTCLSNLEECVALQYSHILRCGGLRIQHDVNEVPTCNVSERMI